MSEQAWMERAQNAEALLQTSAENTARLKEKLRGFTEMFGIKQSMEHGISIDFDRLVDNLGIEKSLELRAIIDEKYSISGAAGEKPRVTVKAA